MPRFDLKLPENLRQVVLDRPGTEEHPVGDLRVGEPLSYELRDLGFLRRQF